MEKAGVKRASASQGRAAKTKTRSSAPPKSAPKIKAVGTTKKERASSRPPATANSVLVISFARERLDALGDATAAALEAGFVRFRPVLMTALAMIIGMTPMALGLGDGGEQNAPLGRAVIGGLVFATVATLVFVPVVFSLVHARRDRKAVPGAAIGELHAS